jgi:ATP-dependent Clp protease adapter protein ClpS
MAIQLKQRPALHLSFVVVTFLVFLGGDVASAWLPSSSRATGTSRSRTANLLPLSAVDGGLLARRSPFRLNAGPAVLEPPTKETTVEKVEKKEEKKESAFNYKKGGWAVRLFNDPFNKREFVSMVLCKICGLSDGQSYQVMMQAHKNGVSVVGRYDFERAELYKTALVENGLLSDMIPVDED